MQYLAVVILLIASFLLGYYFRNLTDKVGKLEEEVKQKVSKPKKEPDSVVIDPLDPVQEAIYQQKKLQERLNGKDSQDS